MNVLTLDTRLLFASHWNKELRLQFLSVDVLYFFEQTLRLLFSMQPSMAAWFTYVWQYSYRCIATLHIEQLGKRSHNAMNVRLSAVHEASLFTVSSGNKLYSMNSPSTSLVTVVGHSCVHVLCILAMAII